MKLLVCPRCAENLVEVNGRFADVEQCPTCGGVWMENEELMLYLYARLKEDTVPEDGVHLDRKVLQEFRLHTDLVCPVDGKQLAAFVYGYDSNVVLDRCGSCGGVWVDQADVTPLTIYLRGNEKMRTLGETLSKRARDRSEAKPLVASPHYVAKYPILLGDKKIDFFFPAGVFSLILSCVILYLVPRLLGFSEEVLVLAWAFFPFEATTLPGLVHSVSSVLMHGGWYHLIGNMFYLFVFGDNVEYKLGQVRFVVYFLWLGLMTNYVYAALTLHPHTPVWGASGAISGILGAYFVIGRKLELKVFWINRVVRVKAYVFIFGWLFLQFINLLDGTNSIAWLAHIVGFFLGAISMYLMKRLDMFELHQNFLFRKGEV